jgi:hypothetical protein
MAESPTMTPSCRRLRKPEILMDLSLSDDLVELKERTERFVRDRILPFGTDPRQTPHGPGEDLRRELVALGREAGLLSPHVGRNCAGFGSLGDTWVDTTTSHGD